MSKVTLIGDLHGHIYRWLEYVQRYENTIQVGDFGFGFLWPKDEEIARTVLALPNHLAIRGNHDLPSEPSFVPDGHYDEARDIMFVGGAFSIDQAYRTKNVDWWPDEEISDERFEQIIEDYRRIKPGVMVTHDAPESIIDPLMGIRQTIPNRTRTHLETMLQIHRPKIWAFGHWHRSVDETLNGTRFICLAEHQAVEIELPTKHA